LPGIDEIFRLQVKTIKHIPVYLRSRVAASLSASLSRIAKNPENVKAWSDFFLFFPCVLRQHRIRGGKRRRHQPIAHFLASSLSRWESGDIAGLWDNARAEMDRRQHLLSSSNSRRVRRVKQLVREGRFGKAASALTSGGVALPSDDVVRALEAKHPVRDQPWVPCTPPPEASTFDSSEVRKALLSFPNGTAGGSSGCLAQHLKDCLDCRAPQIADSFLSSLRDVINVLSKGLAPTSIARSLAGGKLVALNKKGGGVRPICVGEVLRRLVSKLFCGLYKDEAAGFFSPQQVGVGVSGGSEAILHSLSAFVEAFGNDSAYVMLKIDFRNAFNLVSRRDFISRLRESKFTGMCSWVEWCYSVFGDLHLGTSTISSCEGVQQGDPLGPFLFSLSLSGITDHIQRLCPSLALNVWFLDDGTLVGTTTDVRKALGAIIEFGPDMGLFLNLQKCELWWPSLDPTLVADFPADIPRTSGNGVLFGREPSQADGVELLGGPIGNANFAALYMHQRLDRLEDTLRALRDIDDGQIELILLRCCLGVPRMGYAIRCCSPEAIGDTLGRFDDLLSTQLEAIIASPLTPQARRLASLPIRLGGLGISEVGRVAAPAFIASVLSTRSLQNQILARSDLPVPGFDAAVRSYTGDNNIDPREFLQQIALHQEFSQKELCDVVHQTSLDSILNSSSIRNQAAIRSNGGRHAGAFLLAVPNPQLNLRIESDTFRVLTRKRLCLPVYSPTNSRSICPECKSAALDAYGDHAEICPFSSDRVSRHNIIRDILGNDFAAAGCPIRKEVQVLPASQQIPADLYCPIWSRGRPAAFDVTITSPVQGSLIAGAAKEQGFAARQAEHRKEAKYFEACRDNGVEFIPISVESGGTWGNHALKCFKILIERLAHRTGKPRSQQARYFYQRLSIALQRCIGNTLLRRAPPSGPNTGH
jgi:hypothetical protein